MRVLVFDTETTGKAKFYLPCNDPSQPRLVQLAAAVLDTEERRIKSQFSLIVQPEGFTIPEEASNIHGITTGIARAQGINIDHVLELLLLLGNTVDRLCAFNADYDKLVLSGEYARYNGVGTWEDSVLGNIPLDDAMTPCTGICKLPGNYGDYKWPKLSEAYQHFFGKEIANAHDALGDVKATCRVYLKLLELNALPGLKKPDEPIPAQVEANETQS